MIFDIQIERDILRRCTNLYIGANEYKANKFWQINLKMEKVEVDSLEVPRPSLVLPKDDAVSFLEAMAQALRSAGYDVLKPADVSGELKRINDHLQDMRAIAFKGRVP